MHVAEDVLDLSLLLEVDLLPYNVKNAKKINSKNPTFIVVRLLYFTYNKF